METDFHRIRDDAEEYKSLELPSYMPEVIHDKERTETAHVPDPTEIVSPAFLAHIVLVTRDPTEIVSPAFLAHIVLVTRRLPEMKKWYRTVLGAGSMFESEKMIFLTFNEDHHQVAIFDHDNIEADKDIEPAVCGLHHVAFTYAMLGDLVHTYKRLKAEGILPMRTINHGTTLSNYYLDPDNNRIELQCDTFPNKEELNKYLASRAFNRNPIGVLFDFEEVVERFDRGDDPWEICSPYLMHHGLEDEDGKPTV